MGDRNHNVQLSSPRNNAQIQPVNTNSEENDREAAHQESLQERYRERDEMELLQLYCNNY